MGYGWWVMVKGTFLLLLLLLFWLPFHVMGIFSLPFFFQLYTSLLACHGMQREALHVSKGPTPWGPSTWAKCHPSGLRIHNFGATHHCTFSSKATSMAHEVRVVQWVMCMEQSPWLQNNPKTLRQTLSNGSTLVEATTHVVVVVALRHDMTSTIAIVGMFEAHVLGQIVATFHSRYRFPICSFYPFVSS